MKIALTLLKNDINGPIESSFGRAAYLAVYDDQTDKVVYLANTARYQQGGAGVSSAQMVIDQNVEVAIIPQCGEKAYRALNAAHIQLYQATLATGKANLDAYKKGELPRLNPGETGVNKRRL